MGMIEVEMNCAYRRKLQQSFALLQVARFQLFIKSGVDTARRLPLSRALVQWKSAFGALEVDVSLDWTVAATSFHGFISNAYYNAMHHGAKGAMHLISLAIRRHDSSSLE